MLKGALASSLNFLYGFRSEIELFVAEVTEKADAPIEQGKGMSPVQFEVPYHPDSFKVP